MNKFAHKRVCICVGVCGCVPTTPAVYINWNFGADLWLFRRILKLQMALPNIVSCGCPCPSLVCVWPGQLSSDGPGYIDIATAISATRN